MIPAPLQGLDLLCLLRENPARTGCAWAGFAKLMKVALPACTLF